MNIPPDRPVRLEILSLPAHLPIVRAATEKVCKLIGFNEHSASAIVLSVDEALSNVIRHAYDGAEDKPIDIELTGDQDADGLGITIRVRDYGKEVHPSQIKSRDLGDVRPGGLGVHIISECMDEVSYSPADGGGTVLTMRKKLLPQSKGYRK